jgi:NAD(P)-dependent dehydrogenase (short-subunit alcohol dehydrogenase family)
MADLKTVLVTGASGGLGTAVTRVLAAQGWRVIGVDRGLETDPSADPDDGVVTVAADVMDPESAAGAVRRAAEDPAAPLRAVVNLVGGYAAGGRVHETPVADFERQFHLNVRSAYVVTAAALPYLVAAGGGSVVCVSSRAAVRPFAGAAGYIASKAALLALVEALAVEYRDDGVRANAVLPSVIDTPANRAAQPDADVARWVSPDQIAEVIAFLCGDASAATSGARIPVYGRA